VECNHADGVIVAMQMFCDDDDAAAAADDVDSIAPGKYITWFTTLRRSIA